MNEQLTLDGNAVPQALVRAASSQLSPAQREILRWIRDRGSIRALEAGAIVHAHRSPPCWSCARHEAKPCGYASSDGSDALKRLAARGLVSRRIGGGWSAA